MKKTITSGLLWLFAAVVFSAQAQSYYATKVFDFLPAPGQFTNETIARSTSADNVIGSTPSMVSLGSFGGYIVVGFDRPIVNDPQNPYGVDFSIEGNSFAGNAYGQWCEPGAIQVMKDLNGDGLPNDGEWYELAGSDYYLSTTQRNVTVTYYNPHYSTRYAVPWSADNGTYGALVVNRFHSHPYYPDPFDFGTHILDSVSFTGNKIRGTVNMSSPSYLNPHRAPAFGYCDSKGVNEPLTRPQNPYTAGTDGFDLNWAIDSEGNHVDLDTVHFVRIYNAGFANIGWLGEWSTEVISVGVTIPDPEYAPQDYYRHYIGITQLHVLKGHSCQYDGLLFKNGRPIDEGAPRWWTSDPTVATVDNEGNLSALELGEIWLYFSQKDDVKTDSVPVKIVELRRVVLEMEGNNASVSSDSTSLLVGEKTYIIGECEDNRTEVLNATVANRFVYDPLIWTSSHPEVGEIDNGLFTAFAPGRTMIYARSTSAPDLQDSILVIVNPIPEVQPVSDFIQIPTFAPQGSYAPSELFTTGTSAEIILLSVASKNGTSAANLENNRFHYRFEPGEFNADTVRFSLKVFGEEHEFDLTFAYAAAVRSIEKQILFTHRDAEGVQSIKSWTPDSDETTTLAANLPATVADMQLDGAFLFVAAGNSLFRYNVSTAKLEGSQTLDYTPRKLLTVENRIFVAGQQDAAAKLFVYYKTDFTPANAIDLPAEVAAMTARGDTIYAVLNGADNSAMAIVNLALNTVALEKTIDWGSDGLNVSDLAAKGDKLFAVRRKTDTTSAAVIIFSTTDETRTVAGNLNVEYLFPHSSALIEPVTGDTLLLKNRRGFTKFDTATLTLETSTTMNDRNRYSAGAVYDPEERKYYVAHNTADGNSQGSVYSTNFVQEKTFSGLGTDPAILRFAPALADNDRPGIKAAISDERIVERMQNTVIAINKANSFTDQENNFRIYPKSTHPFLSWTRTGENLRYSAFFDGRVSEDSTVTVEIEAIDHYGCATVSTFTLTIMPRIYTPRISTPLTDRTVSPGAGDLSLSIADLFEFFPANVAVHNLKSVQANTRPDLVTAVIDETTDSLRLSFAPRLSGEALITLRGTTEETAPDEPGKPESKYVDFTFTVTVEAGMSIPVTPEAKPRVYPNPFAGYIILDTATGGKLVISDLSGKAVFATSAKPGSNRINVSALPKGVYLLKHGTRTIKIVK
jgi:hypothetical protein